MQSSKQRLDTRHLLTTCRLQDIWDNDQNVYVGTFEQIATTTWIQYMAITLNKSKF
jgi:hypothetical protein